MAIDPVKIPTDIQIEEKIIGPIGLRQIFILLITGGLSYSLWGTVGTQPGAGMIIKILSWSPMLLGAAFAFIKIHDVSLLRLLLLYIEKLQKPSKRTFGPREGITINIHIDRTAKRKQQLSKAETTEEQLEELSTVLDTGPNEEKHQITQEKTEGTRKPVNPERIAASAAQAHETKIDTIVPKKEEIEHTKGIIRDIIPPQA